MGSIGQPTPTKAKPIVVIVCPPETGHTTPLLPHAAHLTKQGYEVHMIAGLPTEGPIRRTGAEFYAVESTWTPDKYDKMILLPDGPPRLVFGLKNVFVDLTPSIMRILQNVLEKLRAEQSEREVVIVQELASMAIWPFMLGAPLPKGYARFPKVITVSTTPLVMSSVDTAPFGPGLPPDSSEEGRARNAAMYKAGEPLWNEVAEYANAKFKELGAKREFSGSLLDFLTVGGADLQVMLYSSSLEYPRSDIPSHIRFIGGTPRKEVDPATVLPEWWAEIEAAKHAGKKVVFVSQGTVMVDYNMLVIPTIKAMANRDDCIVVAVLGVKDAKLEDVTVPANVRIVDYLLYDAILPYADVFVTNAGFGGFMHGVMNGVPMVLAGVDRKSPGLHLCEC
ncbi:glycosyltransferase [Aspergillus stella-maris]|uniref:glycosyltransferase n=1 Tax=Aspergillus stella-maris TaxID=1810926 RepID=UPI003CCD85F3